MKITKLRRNQIAHTWSPQKFREVIQIPLVPNSFSRYEVQLKRMPLYQSPSLTVCKFLNTLTSLTESSGTPNSGEYFIDYMPINDSQTFEGSGIITFNSADAGKWVIIEYYEVGTIDLEEIYEEKFNNYGNLLIRETESPISVNGTIFSYPEISKNSLSQTIFYITQNSGILKRKYASIYLTSNFQGYLTELDGTNNQLTTTVIQTKTYTYLDKDLKVFFAGSYLTNQKVMLKSVNAINASNVGSAIDLASFIPFFVFQAASVRVGDIVYFFGCSTTYASGPYSKSFKIDINTNQVTLLVDLPATSNGYSTAIHQNGYIYFLHNGICYKYDIINNSFTSTTIDFTSLNNLSFVNNELYVENKQGLIQILCHTYDGVNRGWNILNIDFDNSVFNLIQINNDYVNDGNRKLNYKLFSKLIDNECYLPQITTGYKKANDNSKVFLSLTESPTGEAYLLSMAGVPSFNPDGYGGYAVVLPRFTYKIGDTNYSTSGYTNSPIANGQYLWVTTAGTLNAGAYPTDQKVCPILRCVSASSGTFDNFGMKHTYPEVKKLHSVYFTGFPVDFD